MALWSGTRAESVALVGFGFDSVIEFSAASVLLWRLRKQAGGAPREEVEAAEHRVHRFIGGTVLALAVYVVAEAGWTLWRQEPPEESVVGILLAAASLVIMPFVYWGSPRGDCLVLAMCVGYLRDPLIV